MIRGLSTKYLNSAGYYLMNIKDEIPMYMNEETNTSFIVVKDTRGNLINYPVIDFDDLNYLKKNFYVPDVYELTRNISVNKLLSSSIEKYINNSDYDLLVVGDIVYLKSNNISYRNTFDFEDITFKYENIGNYSSVINGIFSNIKKLEYLNNDNSKEISNYKRVLSYILTKLELENKGKQPYKTFYIPKSDGTKREINEPDPKIKDLLRRDAYTLNAILEYRASMKNVDENITAYRNKKSIKDNVLLHKENKHVIKFDISKFFDNCHYNYWIDNLLYFVKDIDLKGEIINSMEGIWYREDNKGLYMGSPMSPALANLTILPAIKYIKDIVSKNSSDVKVSIYADDITFSSNTGINDFFNVHNLRHLINYSFKQLNLDLEIKKEKTRYMKNNNRHITGISINDDNKLTLSRNKFRKLKMELFLVDRGYKTFTELEDFRSFSQYLGIINYYKEIDDTGKVNKLLKQYANVYNKLVNNVKKGML